MEIDKEKALKDFNATSGEIQDICEIGGIDEKVKKRIKKEHWRLFSKIFGEVKESQDHDLNN